jgi:hypothetical protein
MIDYTLIIKQASSVACVKSLYRKTLRERRSYPNKESLFMMSYVNFLWTYIRHSPHLIIYPLIKY